MANRYPLIVDSSSENIKELPAGDGLLFADNDKIVIGGGIIDNLQADVPGGVVRAYDVRTGELLWYWEPIPPGWEPVLDEIDNHLFQKSTTNVWSIISADP